MRAGRCLSPLCCATALLTASGWANAQTGLASTCDSQTVVLHINGVWTTPEGADLNRDRLEDAFNFKIEESYRYRFRVGYNPTDGKIADVVEAISQAIPSQLRTDPTVIQQWITGLTPAPPVVADILVSALASASAAPASDTVTAALRSTVQALANANNRVLIVSHSQGNFFANEILRGLTGTAKSVIGMQGVAVPDHGIADPVGSYTNDTNDRVIAAIGSIEAQSGASPPLAPNVTNSSTYDDPKRHSFAYFYLFPGSNTEADILTKAQARLAVLPCPLDLPPPPTTTSYSFWGHVTTSLPQGAIGTGNLALYFPIPPAVGDLYSITYVVDRSVADTNSANNIGDYPDAIRSVTLTEGTNAPLTLPNGAMQFTLDNTVRVEWSATTNANSLTLNAGGTQGGVQSTAFEASLVLGNAFAGYFGSDGLPTSTPDPSVFLSPNFAFSGAGGYFLGTVEGIGNPPQLQ